MSEIQNDTITWFEIPATDINRAVNFYETVFDFKIIATHEMGASKMAVLPGFNNHQGPMVHGALVQDPSQKPSRDGVTIYFNGLQDLQPALSRVEEAGGKILVKKSSIGEHGFYAHFIDSEGNRIGLHSPN